MIVEADTVPDTLTSYAPELLLQQLADLAAAPSGPRADRLTAAVLSADISGSTALAEELAEQGPGGAEALTRILNAYFGPLIEMIHAAGGDVVKFAGDGLLAMWPVRGNGDGLAVAIQRAASCAIRIQKGLHAEAVADDVHLSVRIGIGAGTLIAGYLGGVADRWEFSISGPAVLQAGAAERYAHPGQTVLSSTALRLLTRRATVQPLSDGLARLKQIEPPPIPDAVPPHIGATVPATALRAFLAPAVLARMLAGQSEWLAELRRVTVVFINLLGVDHRTSLDQAQTIMCAVQIALERFGGGISRLGVGDKGPVVLAAFGLPPHAHEDDAVRALRAATMLQAALSGLHMRSAVGIATGRAFCGSVGSARRREYTIIGDVANLAARLMQAAGEGILCDEPTQQAARAHVTFDALAPITVKGKSHAVPVYRPRATPAQRPPATTALIGRDAERARLVAHLEAVLETGVRRTVIIDGEAGIGKSRLVQALHEYAQDRSIRCLIGAADAIEVSTPYHAWRSVFAQLFDLGNVPEDIELRRQQVHRFIESVAVRAHHDGPALDRLAPLLNAVLPLDLPETELTQQMHGQVRADNTHDLLVRLLQAGVESAPLVVIIEDAHWLDSASWAVLRLISQRVDRIVLVIATRPLQDPQPAEYLQISHAPGTDIVRLSGLSGDAAEMLACRRLGVSSIPPAVATLIRDKAAGNPFFTEELAYMLRDRGVIIVSGTSGHLAPHSGDLRALSVPDTLEGVVTSRIDRLTPRQQLSLKVASVLGRVALFAAVCAIYPIESDRLALAGELEALTRSDVLAVESPAPALAYIFKHVIIQDVCYNLMPFAQRQELHRAAAEWYERTQAHQLPAYAALLAHHWNAAAGAQPRDGCGCCQSLGLFGAGRRAGTRQFRQCGSGAILRRGAAIVPARCSNVARGSAGAASRALGTAARRGMLPARDAAGCAYSSATGARHRRSPGSRIGWRSGAALRGAAGAASGSPLWVAGAADCAAGAREFAGCRTRV